MFKAKIYGRVFFSIISQYQRKITFQPSLVHHHELASGRSAQHSFENISKIKTEYVLATISLATHSVILLFLIIESHEFPQPSVKRQHIRRPMLRELIKS